MAPEMTTATSFAEDLAFLEKHGAVIVLRGEGASRVAVSPEYQGRVMTSAVSEGQRSLGWIHRAFIAGTERATPFTRRAR